MIEERIKFWVHVQKRLWWTVGTWMLPFPQSHGHKTFWRGSLKTCSCCCFFLLVWNECSTTCICRDIMTNGPTWQHTEISNFASCGCFLSTTVLLSGFMSHICLRLRTPPAPAISPAYLSRVSLYVYVDRLYVTFRIVKEHYCFVLFFFIQTLFWISGWGGSLSVAWRCSSAAAGRPALPSRSSSSSLSLSSL